MGREPSESPAPSLRLSHRLRLLAVLTTLLTVGICAALLWSALDAFFDEAGLSAAPEDQATPPIVVAIGRTPGGPGEWISYAAAFANLQDDLDHPVQLRYVSEGAEITGLVRADQVDIALVTVGTYLDLEADGSASLLVAPVVDGQERDAAVLVVAARSEARTLEELRGQTVAITGGSLSGDRYAAWLMRENGTTIEAFFGGVLRAESQDTALADVDAGQVAAACVRRSGLASWPEDAFRVIAMSEEFGMPPVVVRDGLDPELTGRIRESLLRFDGAAELPRSSLLDRFAPVTPGEYAFARVLDGLPAYGEAQ